MTHEQRKALVRIDTDISGVERRFCGDDALYISCLSLFLSDSTMEQLTRALSLRLWDDAFTAAHALKGLAGNMGFVPLMHSTGQLVALIRGGRTLEISDALLRVRMDYAEITDVINQNFICAITEGE
ncbi:MAG: Hpt domain-containing protein [Eubacteriales bacterium]|nr:Hpt domain-containing protein [Eubacteriales bacterium]MDD3881046.1 Hpt domain-containing protein [Eubacteriales bacterium]MDD4511885.1 Hpt domain-containing protein [Eubacteriales bacterium]